MYNGLTFASCMLAAVASLCFVGGMAVLTGGKGR